MIETPTTDRGAQPEYARLLAEALPTVIRDEAQHEEYLTRVSGLLRREKSLTAAERELVQLLTVLLEDFEEKHFSLPRAEPVGVVSFLMEQHGLKQKDMNDVFGTPSITSEVLNGKRALNKEHIRRLSERFHVSPASFF